MGQIQKYCLRGPYDIWYTSVKMLYKGLKVYVDTKYTFYNQKQVKRSISKK